MCIRYRHESSLSPYVHSILASRIGDITKAYNLFLHATRLDLDDYNNELDQGLPITSMAGSWIDIVHGFAGMQIKDDMLCFNPVIPEKWNRYTFKIHFRQCTLQIEIGKEEIKISMIEGDEPVSYTHLYAIAFFINQTITLRQIENTNRLTHHLINNFVIHTNKACTIHTCERHIFFCTQRLPIISSIQRK